MTQQAVLLCALIPDDVRRNTPAACPIEECAFIIVGGLCWQRAASDAPEMNLAGCFCPRLRDEEKYERR